MPIGGSGDGAAVVVGGSSDVDLNNPGNSIENELMAEAVERSKVIYSQDAARASDPLKKIVNVKKQIVSGILFRVKWETESGKIVVVSIHIVPWKEGEERFPALDNPIVD